MNNDENERVLVAVLAMLLLPIVIPALAPQLAAGTGRWMREHAILVDPRHAVFTIPYLQAGPDAQRLILLALLLTAGTLLHVWTRKKPSRA